MEKITGFFRLMRLANVVTAASDILAGIAISGFFLLDIHDTAPVVWLILATIGLYGGGVVMNDVFDADLDARERPERPIPSGLVSKGEGTVLGLGLLTGGIVMAFLASATSGLFALAIAILALAYDRWAKHRSLLGPLTMGLCRGLNLLLGISIIPTQVPEFWFLGIVPVIYIAAITMISQGEVHGGKRTTLYLAAVLYAIAMGGIFYVATMRDQAVVTALFVALWALMVFLPLKNAIVKPEGKMIGRAVKAGVLALILMNAAWASSFGATYLALIIILLLPLSILLAKVFAVT